MQVTGHTEAKSKYYDDVFQSGVYNQAARMPLYKRIFSIIKKHDNPRVLEIGCGTGDLGKLLVDEGIPYRGFDFSEKGLENCRNICPDGDFHFGDAYDPKMYEPYDYNIVVALEVLEHIDDLKVIENIPPDVMLIASVPDYDDESHLRLYTDPKKDIFDRFANLLEIQEVGVLNGQNPQTGEIRHVYFFEGMKRAVENDTRQITANRLTLRKIQQEQNNTAEKNNADSRKLHLGCGRSVLEGWINLDCVKLDGVDVVADLDKCETSKLPFEDDYFEEILASHLIEHIENPMPLMQELHRIAKNNACAIFRLPYGSSDAAFEDPTHVRQYFINSFGYFSQPYYWRADYGYRGDWATEKIILSVDKNRYQGKRADEIALEIDRYRNVVKEMIVELRAVKPIREPNRELIVPPKIELNLI